MLTQEECSSEELHVDGKVARALAAVEGGRLRKLWGLTMYQKDDMLVGHTLIYHM